MSPGDWPTLRPLSDLRLPGCPVEVLPDRLRRFSVEVARSTETDVAMAVLMALGVSAGAVSRGSVARGGHVEPLVLWCVVVAESGERKSEIARTVRRPLDRVAEHFRNDSHRRSALATAQAEWDAAAARVYRAEAALKKDKGDRHAQTLELADARCALDSLGPRPTSPNLLVQDATPERLGQRLEANGRAGIGEIAILVDAESSLDALSGTRTESNAALLLKTHAGDTHTDDRVGRPGVTISSPRLSLSLATQPVTMRDLASDRSLSDRGLLARMMIVAPTARAHMKQGPTPSPANDPELSGWLDHVEALARVSAEYVQTPRHPHSNPTYAFDRDAGDEIRKLEVRLSRRLAPGEDLADGNVRRWVSKAHGLAQRLAAVLHALDADDAQPWLTPISLPTTTAAIGLVEEWALPHAQAFLGTTDPLAEAASVTWRHLARWERANPGELTTRRIVWDALRRVAPFGTRDKPGIEEALFDRTLEDLTDRGHIRMLNRPGDRTGRPPSPSIQIRDI